MRDATCEVLGTLLKALGERPMIAYLENIDKAKTAKVCIHVTHMYKTLDVTSYVHTHRLMNSKTRWK